MKASNLTVLTLAAFFLPGTTATGHPPEARGLLMEGSFLALDGDADGNLFVAARPGPVRDSLQLRFATLDAVGSGVITEDELSRAMVRPFARLDGDCDAAVSLDEPKAGAPSGKPES